MTTLYNITKTEKTDILSSAHAAHSICETTDIKSLCLADIIELAQIFNAYRKDYGNMWDWYPMFLTASIVHVITKWLVSMKWSFKVDSMGCFMTFKTFDGVTIVDIEQ